MYMLEKIKMLVSGNKQPNNIHASSISFLWSQWTFCQEKVKSQQLFGLPVCFLVPLPTTPLLPQDQHILVTYVNIPSGLS